MNYYSFVQRWLEEMAAYVKSIDKKHLLTVGTEGFYGPTSPQGKLNVNPGTWKTNSYGSDFIRNSKIPDIDFASIHLYPDTWYGSHPNHHHHFFHLIVSSPSVRVIRN